MKELDEIIFDAINANSTLAAVTGGRIHSTCIEVPPTDDDNTPLPFIIIAEDPSHNDQGTKDSVWEGSWDVVNVSVIINAESPGEVKRLRRLVRKAVSSYVMSMEEGHPLLTSLSYDGVAWDWMKPCFYDTLHYQCDMDLAQLNEESDEQEENL